MNNIYNQIVERYDREYKSLSQKNRRYYKSNGTFNKAYLKQMEFIKANKEMAKKKIVKVKSKSNYVVMTENYGKELMGFGFNQHSIYRHANRDYSGDGQYRFDLYTKNRYSKTTYRDLDTMMDRLINNNNISLIWACIEPDIDKVTREVDKHSNHVHFAYKTEYDNELIPKYRMAKLLGVDRHNLQQSEYIKDSMAYFTKHIGKSLSYHNIYA